MIKPTITLQELRRRIYVHAKAEKQHRFWGLYVHVTKMETLREAYKLAKQNDGSPGIDGVSFEMIEESGVEKFLSDIQQSLVDKTYRSTKNRIATIPKGKDKVRTLGIPTVRDRVVQGALKLIIEPVFEADFQEGSFGYRPKRSQHQAVNRVERAMAQGMTRVIDLDLSSYFDSVKHHLLLNKVAERIDDDQIMYLLKMMLKAGGVVGVPQGGVISPLLSNIYLNEVDKMLEKARETTRNGEYIHLEYARFADDLVILVNWRWKMDWVWYGVQKRLKEEMQKLQVQINEEKTKRIDLRKGESFTFLGFEMRMVKTLSGKQRPNMQPSRKAKAKLLESLRTEFRKLRSQPMTKVRDKINPILRGWIDYFRYGQSEKVFQYLKMWLNKKIRRHLMKARGKLGFGWKRWSTVGLFAMYNIYVDFHLKRWKAQTNR